eukprot:3187788-Amphidinium_carterae.1
MVWFRAGPQYLRCSAVHNTSRWGQVEFENGGNHTFLAQTISQLLQETTVQQCQLHLDKIKDDKK